MSALAEYVTKLDAADEAERIYAAEDIGYLNGAEGVAALLARLEKESSRAVREAIFQALLRIDADAAIEGSIGLLASDEPQIRNQAVEVLRRKGTRPVPFLHNAMRDGDKDLRKLVLDVLSEVHTGSADAIYDAALRDEEPNVVITAVDNVGKARATRFRPRIEELLLTGTHPMLVGVCLEALGWIGDEHSLEAIRHRFPELANISGLFQVSCLKALGALGTAVDFGEVVNLLAVSAPRLRPAILGALIAIEQRHPGCTVARNLLPALRAVIEGGDPPLCRYQAVLVLGFLRSGDDAYSFLVSCLASPERLVRLGAVESLRKTARPGLDKAFAACVLVETDEEVRQALNC